MAKKASSPTKVVDPRHVYRHAMGYLWAESFLRTKAGEDPQFGQIVNIAGATISAFASELMLKYLLYLEGKPNAAKGHDLKALFDSLDKAHQDAIEKLWDKKNRERKDQLDAVEKGSGVKIARDLQTALAECGDAFVEFRYLYEGKPTPSFYIAFFPQHVRDVIKHETGWPE